MMRYSQTNSDAPEKKLELYSYENNQVCLRRRRPVGRWFAKSVLRICCDGVLFVLTYVEGLFHSSVVCPIGEGSIMRA